MDADDDFGSIADLPDDGSRQKETYARYGLAAFHAQVFEIGLANLIVVATSDSKQGQETWTVREIDSLFEDLYSHTAGKLVTRLKQFIDQPEFIELLVRAVKERNRLMHRFFREHDRDAMTTAGMQRMVEDADTTRRLFETADQAVTSVVHELLLGRGVGEDAISRQYDTLLAEARVSDGEGHATE